MVGTGTAPWCRPLINIPFQHTASHGALSALISDRLAMLSLEFNPVSQARPRPSGNLRLTPQPSVR